MPENVGVIPEFFYLDDLIPVLTRKFLENVPDNSRIVIYKGVLRKDCYVVIEDSNTRRQRAFSQKYTFNDCISELESADMILSVVKPFMERPKISDKKVNDALRRLWGQVVKEKELL